MKHLAELSEESAKGIKILIALTSEFKTEDENRFKRIDEECKVKYKGKVSFSYVTFENLIGAIKSGALLDETFQAVLSEYEEYLDGNGLLPDWKTKLDVVNCGKYPEEVTSSNAYYGLTSGGAYSHKRCKYFGMYRNKRVEKIAEIEAVVDVGNDEKAEVLWKNKSIKDEELKERAIALKNIYRSGVDVGIKVILLGELYDTDFIKTTKGGMFSHKLYFDVSDLQAENAEQLAEMLKGKKWEELK